MKVSVVVPCYNYGCFLGETVRSVLQHTVSDREVSIVADGSEDESPELARTLLEEDSRVRSFRTPNRGPAPARNRGESEAEGTYRGYLDADDRWLPHKLEPRPAVMESEPGVVMRFSNAIRFTPGGVLPKDRFDFLSGLDEIPTRPANRGHARVIARDPFRSLLARLKLAAPPPTMLRADAVRDPRWRAGPHPAEDFEYLMRVSRQGEVAFSDEVLVETRRHGNHSYNDPLVPLGTTIRALEALRREEGGRASRARRRTRSCGEPDAPVRRSDGITSGGGDRRSPPLSFPTSVEPPGDGFSHQHGAT